MAAALFGAQAAAVKAQEMNLIIVLSKTYGRCSLARTGTLATAGILSTCAYKYYTDT
jgi:hypothetical protein